MRILKTSSVLFTVLAAALFAVTSLFHVLERDREGPVITMESDVIEVSVKDDITSILQGVTAQDAKDGDVTQSLVVENLSNFVADHMRIASIAAFDSDNHVTKVVRTVRYTDYLPTRFSLDTPFSFPVGSKASAVTQNLFAVDCLDGDVTRRITRTNAERSSFNADIPGIYQMVFSVSNSAGDIERFTASVEVYDRADADLPSITLTDTILYLPAGSSFEPLRYLKSISVDGTAYRMYGGMLVRAVVAEQIEQGSSWEMVTQADQYDLNAVEIVDTVDTGAPGWYEVSYTVESAAGTERTAFLLVCIEE